MLSLGTALRNTVLVLVVTTALFCSLPPADAAPRDLRVITFNIQFLGSSRERRNEDLADLLSSYDLIFVQELVAPPYPGTFPDGSPFVPDPESRAFFDAMAKKHFKYVLSEEDSGTGNKNHLNSTATEWFVAFYKPSRLRPASELAQGFLAQDRSNNRDYERVPYAFAFRAGRADLVFISVHLMPGGGNSAKARRKHELSSIFSWIDARPGAERDYVVLGDMNIENCAELATVLQPNTLSLNDKCQATNTNPRNGKPYDQIMYKSAATREINKSRGMTVLNLIEEMRRRWPASQGRFAGHPYVHDTFRKLYSDHHPVLFLVKTGTDDD
jgi:hypothetical protein